MSPKTTIQNESLRQRSMTLIEETALQLFGHQGYANTSISQIAQKAGVSKGLLYNYYQGKDDLLKSIVLAALTESDHIINTQSILDKSSEQVLIDIVDKAIDMAINNRAYWKLITSLALQDDVMDELGDYVKNKGEANIEILEPLFRDLGYPDPRGQVHLFAASLDGIILQFMTLSDEYPMKQVLENMKKTFCKSYQSHD